MTRTNSTKTPAAGVGHSHLEDSVDVLFKRVNDQIAALDARVKVLETPPVVVVPVPPTPPKDLQAAIDATPDGGLLDLTGGSWTGSYRLSKSITIIGGTITGAHGFAAYVAGDVGLNALPASPIARIAIRGTTLRGFADSGIWLRFVDRVEIEDVTVEDCVYAGIMILSAIGGWVKAAKVSRIGVLGASANSNNAYGIALSQQLPGTDRPTSDVTVQACVVQDVPTWHGLDAHAGVRCEFWGNTVSRCRDGIFVTGYPTVRNHDVAVIGNMVVAPAGGDQYGITNVYGTGGSISGNTITGYPAGHAVLVTNGAPADPASVNPTLVVSGNTAW